ncbi:ATP-binding cassette domain-containing protein [Hymenobacter nivis]|uniref:ATP-binding cassette domain-containing protein n=1 Tax=Hymenobacter nivis TaxID=1850093 RepID=A0A502GPJ6_9BACT|nr:ATP-binding cassette domain-containing protein [Hymenobacter nivis]TPG63685.1 ATP-binding cassette domain-containing protein [Hymenobacter nivis]
MSLLALENATVRHLGRPLLTGLNLALEPGQHWALVGPSGAGKSALLATLAGTLTANPGRLNADGLGALAAARRPHDPLYNWTRLVARIGARADLRTRANTTEFYYQQRYNAADADATFTVAEHLAAAAQAAGPGPWTVARAIETLRLGPLLSRSLLQLSNGETKRLLLAAALLKNPALLLLDRPLAGLDAASRASFDALLTEIAAAGVMLVVATGPTEIPAVATHVAALADGRIAWAGPRADYRAPSEAPAAEAAAVDAAELLALLAAGAPAPAFEVLVQLAGASVRYGDKVVLDDIHWTVRPGERWALLGPNGAGKSTLLSLLNGDNPQAYGQPLTLFDRRRGTGESIWDIKKHIGFVSPELFQHFPARSAAASVVESGFDDTLGLRGPSQPARAAVARRWLALLGLEGQADTPFRQLSASGQRLCLLARALVKNPALLILDEPAQGLDGAQQQQFRRVLEALCRASAVALIYVSHYQEELPATITHTLRLDGGKVI